MKIALIGSNGFIGKNLIEQNIFKFTDYYNSKNIHDIYKTNYERNERLC